MSTSSYDIQAQKQVLRKEIRANLRSLTEDDIKSQSQQVWRYLFDLPAYKEASSVGIFLSMPLGEINTDLVLFNAAESGKEIYVPKVGMGFEKADMDMLRVVLPDGEDRRNFHHSWPKNKWKIPEPPDDMPIETAQKGDIDLLVLPGLGFDRDGNRLGQGKGYYDRFLEKIYDETRKKPTLVAVGLECQLVSSVPTSRHDKGVDLVILPNQIIIPKDSYP